MAEKLPSKIGTGGTSSNYIGGFSISPFPCLTTTCGFGQHKYGNRGYLLDLIGFNLRYPSLFAAVFLVGSIIAYPKNSKGLDRTWLLLDICHPREAKQTPGKHDQRASVLEPDLTPPSAPSSLFIVYPMDFLYLIETWINDTSSNPLCHDGPNISCTSPGLHLKHRSRRLHQRVPLGHSTTAWRM